MTAIWTDPVGQLEQIARERGGTVTFRPRRPGERFFAPVVVCAEWPSGGGFSGTEQAGDSPAAAAAQALFSLLCHKQIELAEWEPRP